ncbi:hypothetical protein, partial [Mesorhizobium sp. M7A.F.Ca.US.014.04.1.1]|uniref:hypothetical protein n=1 Tax=Mesorhizobium sp. M7A.F.Ca.US.014.04.1.1 TaxID=2496744 RepID=UPI0019D23BE7
AIGGRRGASMSTYPEDLIYSCDLRTISPKPSDARCVAELTFVIAVALHRCYPRPAAVLGEMFRELLKLSA